MVRARVSANRLVVCPACGRRITRNDAREYDKLGDRWDRAEKSFEYLCRPCHDGLCHHPREGLEDLLCELEAGDGDRDAFLQRYTQAVRRDSGPTEGR